MRVQNNSFHYTTTKLNNQNNLKTNFGLSIKPNIPITPNLNKESLRVLNTLSEKAKTNLATIITKEYLNGQNGLNSLSGKILGKIQTAQDYVLNKGIKRNISRAERYQKKVHAKRAERLIRNHLLPAYTQKVFDENGRLSLKAADYFKEQNLLLGKGFMLEAKSKNLILDSYIRTPLLKLLEEANSYKDIQNGISRVSSIHKK